MRSIDLYSAIRAVDDDILERSETTACKRNKKNGWLKWGAMAACFGLILTAALVTLPGILKGTGGVVPPPAPDPGPVISSTTSLLDYMALMNLDAKEIVNPELFETAEMPVITKEQLKAAIENNTTVQGTVTALNSVCVQDTDTAWYITTMTIAVEEVLNGTADSEVQIVCASNYNEILDSNMVPAPGLSGCHEGMRSVFVLRKIYNEPWTIAGTEIYPTSLGEYFVLYQLERDENTLIFADQNITVSLDESSVLPDKGSAPAECPDTTIIPGFDLDEPNEPAAS